MKEDALSLAEKYDGERFEYVEKFVKRFTPAVGQYLLKDGSWCARVNGLCVFKDHGIFNKQKARDFQS
jgi:hypothetical protein